MMARFAPKEQHAGTSRPGPAFLVFVWEVNDIRPDTFGRPDIQPDTPHPGYETERYPTARVIHGPGDEGIRVVADTPEAAEAFTEAATRLGITLTKPTA